jgi:hypothetical protein
MSAGTLKKLTVAHLRGSTCEFDLPFESGKKLTIVYGENGSGKSTACDALEFVGNGRIGSLENRGLGRPEPYWPSVGKNSTDITVTLETTAGSCIAKTGSAGVVVTPENLRPRVEVLRRTRILELIQAQAGDKYKAIERFIDVAGPETAEGALRDLIKGLKQNRKVAVAVVAENQGTLERAWISDGKTGASALAWAETQSKADTATFEAESKQIEKLSLALQRVKDAVEKISPAAAVETKAKERIATANESLTKALQSATADAGEVVSILEAAKPYLIRHKSPAACPLCESAENANGLGDRVQNRLQSFKSLTAAQSEVKAAERALAEAELKLKSAADTALQNAGEFEKTRADHQWPTDVPLPAAAAPTISAELATWVQSAETFLPKWKTAKDNRADRKIFVTNVKSALDTYRRNFAEQKALDILLPKLDETLAICEDERRKFTDEILSSIAVNVGQLYEAVHPGEGLAKISLALDSKKRASLDMGTSFGPKTGVPPQAYLSDSHLDTLGLCVFLALSQAGDAGNTILVLDDVLASVDEPHVDRLIEMLYTEATKFRHCVITTHYRPWRQKFRWGWLKNGQCHFVELSKWTSTTGMTLIRSVPDVEMLRNLLKATPPDPQLVSAKAGVILEAALDFLTLLYQCAIPRRPDGLYTLGDLLPAIDKKLRTALRVEVLTGTDATGANIYDNRPLAAALDELTRIAQVRNVMGCHFNKLSFDLLDADATVFAQHVLILIDALVDETIGWPKSDKSGSYWATSGETRRLHPLKRPT